MHEQLVCTECGAVISSENIRAVDDSVDRQGTTFCSTSVSYPGLPKLIQHQQATNNRLGEVVLKTIQLLTNVSSTFKLPQELANEAVQLFKVNCNGRFKRAKSAQKSALAASCLYFVTRKQKWGLPVVALRNSFQITQVEFNRALKRLECSFQESDIIPPMTTRDTLPAFLSSLSMPHGISNLEMSKMCSSILDVIENFLQPDGLHRKTYLIPIAFLAHQLLPNGCPKMTLKKFCSIVRVECCQSAASKLKEMQEVFIVLAKKLPWVRGDITTKNLHLYLPNVLKFKSSLCVSLPKEHNVLCDEVVPKCADLLKYQPSFDPVSSEQLGNDDIPENELSRYIRTPEEIKAIVSYKKIRGGVEDIGSK